LRAAELDARREVGAIFCDRRAVKRLAKIFQEDWQAAERIKDQERKDEAAPAEKVAKKLGIWARRFGRQSIQRAGW